MDRSFERTIGSFTEVDDETVRDRACGYPFVGR
jgi:hypothetical protein